MSLIFANVKMVLFVDLTTDLIANFEFGVQFKAKKRANLLLENSEKETSEYNI